jgi:hypothetical protein
MVEESFCGKIYGKLKNVSLPFGEKGGKQETKGKS